jgi:hypothetical protein
MKENQNLTAEAADSAEETAEKIMPCYSLHERYFLYTVKSLDPGF